MTLESRLPVRLAEGTRVEVRIAGIASRAVAAAVDLGIAMTVILAVTAGAGGLGSPSDWWLGSSRAFGLLAGLVGFPLVCELVTGGSTPGKSVVGLRVVAADGGLLTSRALVVRNVLRVVDALPLPYGIGLVAASVSARGQRLGDLAAGTTVIRRARVDVGALEAPSTAALTWAASKTPGQVIDPRIWDTAGLDASDLRAVRRFLVRRWSLPTNVRIWAANELVQRVAPKVMGAPSEITPEALLEGVVLGRGEASGARR